jgi:glycosyltransferase involved in cell wall biosynthesis
MGLKKILLINWRDIRNPEAGGAEVYYHEIFKRLASRGQYDITVLSHEFAGAPAREDVDGIHTIRRGSRLLFNYSVIPFLRKHDREYDLIIEDINKVPFFTPLFTKRSRLCMVMHFFGSAIFNELAFPMALYIFAGEKLVPLFYSREKFVVLSNSTRDEVRAFTGANATIEVVEPGIDTDFYSPGPKQDPPYLLYMGRIKKYKNVQFLVRSFPLLAKRFPKFSLKVAGGGDYVPEIRTLVQNMGLDDKIILEGHVSEKQKRELLRGATLVLNPSIKEGWGITNIEANLCGTVSISSRVAGLRDSVIDNKTGLLFEYNNKDDFIKKVAMLLEDNKKRVTMEQEGVLFARSLSWNNMTDKMEMVLKEVIK